MNGVCLAISRPESRRSGAVPPEVTHGSPPGRFRLARDSFSSRRTGNYTRKVSQAPAGHGENPQRAGADWPPVVVAGGYLTGIVLMRDLLKRGVKVSCVECNPEQPAFRSVYGETHRCPNPDTHGDEWAEFMLAHARRTGKRPILMASADQFISAIDRYKVVLSREYTVSPGAGTQATLATKERQYDIARQNGMPVPHTRAIASEADLEVFIAEARLPCVLKPMHFRHWERFPPGHPLLWQKVAVANTPEELRSAYQLVRSVTPEVVVQETILGPDTAKLVYLSCYGTGGERLGHALVSQWRAWPANFGSAAVVQPVDDPETVRTCDNFLRSLRYTGFCELELKRDTRDGVVRLIEANPRYSTTSDAARCAGVDLPWLHYLDLAGQKVRPVQPAQVDFRHIHLTRDIPYFRRYKPQGLIGWKQFLQAYRPPVYLFDFDLRDWRVSGNTLWQLSKGVIAPTYRRFMLKRNVISQ